MKPKIQTAPKDFLRSGSGGRILASNGYDVRALRTNDLLRKDEWKRYDEAVVRVARQRLGVVNRLRLAGLVFPAGNLGNMILEWEKLSDMTEADQSMGLVTRGERDRGTFDLDAIPIPITHKEFEINLRHLTASRNRGSALDVTNGELAGAVVAEKLEATVINGSAVKVGGYQAYGFRNFPSRLTGNLGADWSAAATTGENIKDDVLTMIAALKAKNMYGPYEMFVGTAYDNALNDDYKSSSDKTVRQRLLELNDISAITTSAKIPDGDVIMVQMTSNVIDLAVSQDIVTVEWAEMGGFNQVFVVFAAMAPRLKVDAEGQSGIAHYSKP